MLAWQIKCPRLEAYFLGSRSSTLLFLPNKMQQRWAQRFWTQLGNKGLTHEGGYCTQCAIAEDCLCDEAMERVAGKTETCAALIQVYVAVAKATKFDIGPPTEQVAETLDNLFVLKGAFVDLNSEIFTGKSVSALCLGGYCVRTQVSVRVRSL